MHVTIRPLTADDAEASPGRTGQSLGAGSLEQGRRSRAKRWAPETFGLDVTVARAYPRPALV